MSNTDLSTLEASLCYTFRSKDLLQEALTHSSYTHEYGLTCSNERMELLGDAVLHLVLTEFLMQSFPEDNEGQLSALRSYCESEPVLCMQALKLNLGAFIHFGKGEQLSGGAQKDSLLANTFEALLAAIHLDGGYAAAQSFILRLMKDDMLAAYDSKLHIVSMYELQRITQKHSKILPEYEVVSESGLDHDKMFGVQVRVMLNERELTAVGHGRNKKAAEKHAASMILEQLEA